MSWNFPARRRVVALVLGTLAVLALTTPAVQAYPARPGLAVHVTPRAVSTTPGGTAAYEVAVSSVNGFTGQVRLNVAGLPGGANSVFAPASPLTLDESSTVSVTLTVQVPEATHANTYPLKVTATGNRVRARDVALLRVTPPPGITLAVTPPVRAATAGSTAAYTAKVTARHGFEGDVTFGVGALPPGVSLAGIVPGTVHLDQHHRRGRATVTLAVAEGTAPDTYPVTVTVAGAGGSASDNAELRVVPEGTLTVTADPTEVSVAQGENAGVTITVQRSGVNGNAWLVATGLPPGTRTRFEPPVLRPGQDTSQLTIRVDRNTPPGSYPVTVTARSGNVNGSTVVTLEVVASGLPFTISGDLDEDLYPGLTVPLNLTLDNPNSQPLRVRGLYVTIDHLDAAGTCPITDNFAVTQFSGDYGDLVIPAEGSASLDGLGIPETAWPQVTMIETGTNQDGCMGAELSLHYTGTAIGGQP